MDAPPQGSDLEILKWHLEQGAADLLEASPVNRLEARPLPMAPPISEVAPAAPSPRPVSSKSPPSSFEMPLGTADARREAQRLAASAATLEELAAAIAAFEGLSIRKTATNMVFSDGNVRSPVMVVGEAPGADEDIKGKPFVGVSGRLLDRMFAAIGLDRANDDPAASFYISNILNWRPPGNRTPSAAEIEISLPFIERHIALVQPRLLVFMGGVAAKALLNTEEGITKLRGKWTRYMPQTESGGQPVDCLPTFHPSFLLRTPIQKKLAWTDMLLLKEKCAAQDIQ